MYKQRLTGKEDNMETTLTHIHREEEGEGRRERERERERESSLTSLFQTRPVVWYFLT
jgi:hypothetical protein